MSDPTPYAMKMWGVLEAMATLFEELFPPISAAMEGLLPRMLPLITPLVVPRMIRYIREEL